MKTVIFMRHASALSYSNDGYDHTRELSSFGIKEVNYVASKLKDTGFSPDLILTSDAIRAKKTAAIVHKNFSKTAQIIHTNLLYLADSEAILNQLLGLSNTFNIVLLISHNPGLTLLVNKLGYQTKSLLEAQIVIFKFEFHDWTDLYTTKPEFITTLHSLNL